LPKRKKSKKLLAALGAVLLAAIAAAIGLKSFLGPALKCDDPDVQRHLVAMAHIRAASLRGSHPYFNIAFESLETVPVGSRKGVRACRAALRAYKTPDGGQHDEIAVDYEVSYDDRNSEKAIVVSILNMSFSAN
jgi:hypothetical protein